MDIKIKNSSLADSVAMIVLLLMGIGTVFVFSASANIVSAIDIQKFYDSTSLRQILFFPLAILILFTVSRFDYRRLNLADTWFKSPSLYLLIVCVILLALVLIPRFGVEVNYARRWLRIPAGPVTISFQPSELAKWAVVIFLAGFCDKYANTLKSYWNRFIPACVIIAVPVALILVEDFGTAALISLLGFLILFIAGARFWHLLTPLPLAAAGFCAILLRSPGRMERIKAFLNPDKFADTVSYQANQSLIAIGSGGMLGKGLGRGICKYGHLPEDTTDFIFAIIAEELGFVGTASVILLFAVFTWIGILIVIRCRDRFGRFLAAGIVLAIAIQAALNLGVVTVVLPTKGIPLPFVSAGGTSMLLSAAAVGILMNIAQQIDNDLPGELI